MDTKRSSWEYSDVSTSLRTHTAMYVLINDAREQTRLCEPKTDAGADELAIPGIEEFGAPNDGKQPD